MTRRGLAALLTLFGTSCAGSASGTVAGFNLAVADAVFMTTLDDEGQPSALSIVLSDKPQRCETMKAGTVWASSSTLVIRLYPGSDARESALGDYVLPSATPQTLSDRAIFNRSGSNCSTGVPGAPLAFSSAGVVKLEALSPGPNGTARGRFEISFGEDELQGQFDATHCDPGPPRTTFTCK